MRDSTSKLDPLLELDQREVIVGGGGVAGGVGDYPGHLQLEPLVLEAVLAEAECEVVREEEVSAVSGSEDPLVGQEDPATECSGD